MSEATILPTEPPPLPYWQLLLIELKWQSLSEEFKLAAIQYLLSMAVETV